MVEFRKQLARGLEYDVIGESVGFFRFGPECALAISRECARFDAEGLGDAPHEEALRNVLLANPEILWFRGCERLTLDRNRLPGGCPAGGRRNTASHNVQITRISEHT